MPLRKLLLRVMLAALAFSAAGGVLAVLVASNPVVWRVIGTGVVTAMAAALMLAMSRFVDRERTRAAGLLGMTAVVVEFLMGLGLIWEIGPLGGWELAEQLAATMGAVAVTALPGMFFLWCAATPASRAAGRVGAAAAAIALVLFLLGTWSPNQGRINWEWWGSGWAVGTFGTLAAGCLAGWPAARRHWRWAGVAAAVAACGFAIIGITYDLHNGGGAFAALVAAAVVVAHANLALLCPLRPRQVWVRWVAVAAAALAAGLVVMIVRTDTGSDDALARAAAAAGIVAGCATLALAILAVLNRRIRPAAVAPVELKDVALTCPNCQKRQTLPVGDSTCGGCGLGFHIRLEEPRCVGCGYLLYHLTAERCPECGREVARGVLSAEG